MKYGIELQEILEQKVIQIKEIMNDRDHRIYVEQSTDLDDCWLSIEVTNSNMQDVKRKLVILKNQGLDKVKKLVRDGKIVDSKIVDGTYGLYWNINTETGFETCPVFSASKKECKKELKKIDIDASEVYSILNKLHSIENPTTEEQNRIDEINSVLDNSEIEFYKSKGFYLIMIEVPVWISKKGFQFESSINYWTGENFNIENIKF